MYPGGFAARSAVAMARMEQVRPGAVAGQVAGVVGASIRVAGLAGLAGIGGSVALSDGKRLISAEVVGFSDAHVVALARDDPSGLVAGTPAVLTGARAALAVCDAWVGRVIDPLGRPLDGRGPLPAGPVPQPLRASPPPAATRSRLGPRVDLGVRVLDLFTPCRAGQRLGLFAGSGIGKSSLLAMLARGVECDVVVLALVGERGREVREFLEDDLGPAGRARAVTVVATSDASPLLRRDAALAAMAVAEHFRDRGKHVLLLMDSVTRFCAALREIGLASGEPPTTRGFPPSVFAELPRLLERAGPGVDAPGVGRITALFTVLVDGDDHDEPVADAARGILDGHVVLDRRIGEAGRYPAVDVLRSLSRTSPGCLPTAAARDVAAARAALARAGSLADLVRLGAYAPGSDAAADRALALAPRIEALLAQPKHEASNSAEAFEALAAVLA